MTYKPSSAQWFASLAASELGVEAQDWPTGATIKADANGTVLVQIKRSEDEQELEVGVIIYGVTKVERIVYARFNGAPVDVIVAAITASYAHALTVASLLPLAALSA